MAEICGLAGQRVLVTAGASGIGRAIVDALVAARRPGPRLRRRPRRRSPPSAQAASRRPARRRPTSPTTPTSTGCSRRRRRGSAGSTCWSTMPASPGRPAASRTSTRPTGGAASRSDLTGQFLCARRAVPLLKAAGGGAIVNMSSAAGRFGYAFRTPYAAAKWGVIGLTQSLAKELGPARHPRQRHPARHRRGPAHRAA